MTEGPPPFVMTRIAGCEVIACMGNITAQTTDAIVNAANSGLLGGGGVDGAIHAAAGPALLEECREIRRSRWPEGLPTGEAVITHGGRLPARYVIHTVGPVWAGGTSGEPEALRNAYTHSLRLAESRRLRSISFPSISTGTYGYPLRDASREAITAVLDHLRSREVSRSGTEGATLRQIRFVLFSERDLADFKGAWKEVGEGRDLSRSSG